MTTARRGDAAARLSPVTRLRRELRVFPRQFWLLAAGFFVLMVGIDMCFPYETFFLRDTMHVSMTTVGLLIGIPIFASIPLYVMGGIFTDRYGRKPGMASGIFVVACLYVTFALATHLWQIGVAIAVEAGFGWALFLTGSNAMVGDLVAHERRAEAYSFTRVALACGMIAGPLLARVIIGAGGYRAVFVTGAVICGVYVLIVLGLFRETRPAAASRQGSLRDIVRGYGVVLRDRRYLVFCLIALLPLYGFGQIWTIFPVTLSAVHGMKPGTWGLLLAFYAACSAVLQYPMVRWLRRRDHLLLMAWASGLIGTGLAAGVLLPWGVPTFAAVFLVSQGVVLLIPFSSTVAAELAPVALRGRYMGTWTLVQMAGYGLGPTFGGKAVDGLGQRSAFILVGALGLLGAVLFAATSRRLRRADDAQRSGDAGGGLDDELLEEPLTAGPPSL